MDTILHDFESDFARLCLAAHRWPCLLRFYLYELVTWGVILYFLLHLVPSPLGKKLQKGYVNLLRGATGFAWKLTRKLVAGIWHTAASVLKALSGKHSKKAK